MAGPTTEILNDDLKDLKREIRERHDMLGKEIHERYDLLGREFHGVSVELAELRGELKVTFQIAKWAGALLVTTILTSGFAGIGWASDINAKVNALNVRSDEKTGDLSAKIDEKFKSVDDKLKAIDARFDRLETLIIKGVDQGRPVQQGKKSEAGTDAAGK